MVSRVRVSRLIRRTVPLIVLGAAGAVAARRRAEARRRAQLMPGPPWGASAAPPEPIAPTAAPGPEAPPEPPPESPEPEAPPEAEPEAGPAGVDASERPDPDEVVTVEAPALVEEEPIAEEPPVEEAPPAQASSGASVTDIVDDLLSPPPTWGDRIEDATVVDGEAEEVQDPPDDRALAEAVRGALAERPGLLPGTVEIEVAGGTVHLSGEVGRAEAIGELERRAGGVPGVRGVHSLLHVPGTPPPTSAEQH